MYHLDPETKPLYFYIKTNCVITNGKKIRCIYLESLILWVLQPQIAIEILQSLGYIRKPVALYYSLRDIHAAVGDLSDEVYGDSGVRTS